MLFITFMADADGWKSGATSGLTNFGLPLKGAFLLVFVFGLSSEVDCCQRRRSWLFFHNLITAQLQLPLSA
jgi:hypothetical protein